MCQTSNLVYYFETPVCRLHQMHVEGHQLHFGFGRTFGLVMACGLLNILVGAVVFLLKWMQHFETISTFFELDYSTAWDNKAIDGTAKLPVGFCLVTAIMYFRKLNRIPRREGGRV